MDCQYANSCPTPPPPPPPPHIPFVPGQLPFTGFDIASIVLVAALILVAAVVLRLATR